MNYNEVINLVIIGNIRDAVNEIDSNYTWVDFVDKLEGDSTMDEKSKFEILIKLMRAYVQR